MTVCMRQMSEIHNESLGSMQKTVDISTKVGRERGMIYVSTCGGGYCDVIILKWWWGGGGGGLVPSPPSLFLELRYWGRVGLGRARG